MYHILPFLLPGFNYKKHSPRRGLPPYRVDEVCPPQCLGELCWRESKLLVEPPMPDRSKGRSQTKCSPWFSRFGAGRGTDRPTPQKITVMKPPETYGGGQDPHMVLSPVEKKNHSVFVSCSALTFIYRLS
jgi:hypothetical protein